MKVSSRMIVFPLVCWKMNTSLGADGGFDKSRQRDTAMDGKTSPLLCGQVTNRQLIRVGCLVLSPSFRFSFSATCFGWFNALARVSGTFGQSLDLAFLENPQCL